MVMSVQFAFGETKAAKTAPAPKKYTELYYQRASLFDVLPVDSNSIVMLGTSLTDANGTNSSACPMCSTEASTAT